MSHKRPRSRLGAPARHPAIGKHAPRGYRRATVPHNSPFKPQPHQENTQPLPRSQTHRNLHFPTDQQRHGGRPDIGTYMPKGLFMKRIHARGHLSLSRNGLCRNGTFSTALTYQDVNNHQNYHTLYHAGFSYMVLYPSFPSDNSLPRRAYLISNSQQDLPLKILIGHELSHLPHNKTHVFPFIYIV